MVRAPLILLNKNAGHVPAFLFVAGYRAPGLHVQSRTPRFISDAINQ